MRIPAQSIEYVHVDVTVQRAGLPAPSAARMAIVTRRATPAEADWRVATVTGSTVRTRYDGDLAPGGYDVWVEITAGDEIPLIEAGRLDLT